MPNQLHITDWLREGTIAPLRWGDSLAEVVAVWPAAQQEAADAWKSGFPFLPLDYLELYFENDGEYSGLQEVLVKVWTIEPKTPALYLAYDWLCRGMTFTQVKAALTELSISFQVEYGPHFRTPAIVGPSGVLFAFYTDFETVESAELMNIYFSREPIRVN